MTSLKLPELKAIFKKNKIKGFAYYNKPQIVEILRERNLLPAEEPQPPPEPERQANDADPKHRKLREIRRNPKEVTMTDTTTGEELVFPSIYKASRHMKTSPRIITFWNGRIWKNRYEIKISEERTLA